MAVRECDWQTAETAVAQTRRPKRRGAFPTIHYAIILAQNVNILPCKGLMKYGSLLP
ncbi:hypothetical protein N184_25355 [Sinorhizobium sp. GL28]|nr:hypothetical protein N184_25355 [Sinorhizobium sp. GL28]